jgi:hypothetical protein
VRRAACFAAAVLALASCGGGRSPYDRGDRDGGIAIAGMDGRVSVIRPGRDANAAYTEGLDLKTKGDCAGAITKLRPVANIGPGYENAQTALGLCLTTTAAQDTELSSDYLEGLTWLRRAGDAGWPEAQGELARVHAFGPAAIRNGAEAAFWLTLYQTNASKMRIGFIPIPTADEAAVEMSLSVADRTAGTERARKWVRNVWLPPAPPEGAPGLGSGRNPRMQERRGPGSE